MQALAQLLILGKLTFCWSGSLQYLSKLAVGFFCERIHEKYYVYILKFIVKNHFKMTNLHL